MILTKFLIVAGPSSVQIACLVSVNLALDGCPRTYMFPELELTVENFNLFLLPWNAFSVYIHAFL